MASTATTFNLVANADFAQKQAQDPAHGEKIVNEAVDVISALSVQGGNPDGTPFQWLRGLPEKIDWGKYREKALSELRAVENPTILDVCGVIDRAVMRLHDRHSYLWGHPDYRRTIRHEDVDTMTWQEQKEKFAALPEAQRAHVTPPQPLPTAQYVGDGDVLHLTVPWFDFDAPGADRDVYRSLLRDALLDAAQKKVKGVIVDLTENAGGSMCPMLWGLSPLLGPGTLGYFGNAGRKPPTPWNVNYGNWEAGPLDAADARNFPLTDIPVAVLTSPPTCSSGEVTLLSFSGRPHTQSFGAPSDGNSSGNIAVNLDSDPGVKLIVCAGLAYDRNMNGSGKGDKRLDGGPIAPDVPSENPLKDALNWIERGAPPLKAAILQAPKDAVSPTPKDAAPAP